MDNNKIGQYIASLRKEKKLTQQQLGDKLFVTDKAVSKWERGLWPYKWHKIKKYKICFILKGKLKKQT